MSTIWGVVLGLTVVCAATKMAGPALLGDRELPAPARRMVVMLAPAMLAGLVVTQLAGDGWTGLELGMLAGVAAAGAARLLRVPTLAALVLGAAVAALVRAVMG
ncbi:Branched-chain amino acid transport protein (AzlD) [Pseudonocardia thermophila]|jgi:Branched-chain amino acid transport protein (AzlD).|uniref:Branched-chain amino acid transport protein (AzlD) n=1 Tax=Pseudonocardia thermophila TaxID=1848 RepID=A0A1M6QBC7_PSETH|nr:AzlD domain-containing protein [Pseudonocardia thermophila]SHK17468.1 Branched-chain amino acid transport protein (AzlD) [Pseudonocardia thermophila]